VIVTKRVQVDTICRVANIEAELDKKMPCPAHIRHRYRKVTDRMNSYMPSPIL